jgi:hypothetical protein
VSSKKRSSGKRKSRQGLSGNPQRRAQQLGQDRRSGRDLSAFRHPLTDQDRAALRELAYRLAGGAPPEPWWRDSHERILASARALTWPARLIDLETQVCQIVGDEFYDRFRSPGTGLHPVQWLRALAEQTGAAARAALAEDADDWHKLWALLCGLALTAPRTPSETADETVSEKLPEFPAIEYPLDTALAEAEKFAAQVAGREVEPGLGRLSDGCRPAGEPLVARDVFGSRYVLVAPFSYECGAPDHWYAWDIDLCWIDVVVGAGVFASPGDALREWQDAVGAAASGAALSPCSAGMTAELLASCLTTGPMADMMQGNEPRDLIREHYRLRRRARDLTSSADAPSGSSSFDAGRVHEVFADWYAIRHDDDPGAVTETAGTICEMWGPHSYPDERSFYACSPHRIGMAAHQIRQSYSPEYANPALRLLPEWTEWCITRTALGGDAASRSREAARSAATALVGDDGDDSAVEDDEPAADDDEAPFRRHE